MPPVSRLLSHPSVSTVALFLTGCSLGTTDYTPCETNAECRDAFGYANVCNKGLCEPAGANDRCSEIYPANLFDDPENSEGVLIIGSLYDHSTDVPETLATQLPIIQVNDYGGLEAHDFALISCDYQENLDFDDDSNDEAAAAGALYLADTIGVSAIVGPATSSQATAAYGALHDGEADYNVVIISPSATSTSLTSIDGVTPDDEDPGLFWRTAPPDDLQGKVLAKLVTDARHTRVVAIHEAGPYGQGLYEAFDANYSFLSTEITYSDQSAMIESITTGTEGFDAVLFFAGDSADIAAFLNAASALDYYSEMPIFMADAARDTDLLDATRADASALFQNIVGTAPAIDFESDVYTAFSAAYSAQYSPSSADDSVYTSYCFDATWLALVGTAWSYYNETTVNGLGIARGLRHISNPSVDDIDQTVLRPTSWADLVASAEAGVDVNVVGASGDLDYDPATGETSGPIDVWVINSAGNGFETTETCTPSTTAIDCIEP